jgi:NADH:ubiquinone oxidoreductase subunit 5 (subunit L)/multisubunit Na+/H+ antiporter MnhA subunit
MEGPTPVSALIHAATMVTAGIYLILRTSFFFEYCEGPILTVMFIVGLLTIFFSADLSVNQPDIKKVVAYSTSSQLGIMLLSCSLSNYSYAFFHLINHGFFKALMFLLVGVIIHAFNEEQDLRNLSGITVILPVISVLFFISSLSLRGFFF